MKFFIMICKFEAMNFEDKEICFPFDK